MVKTKRTEHQGNNFYGGLNVPRSGLRKVLVNPRVGFGLIYGYFDAIIG